MDSHWLNEAVLNNAALCDAVAASHGISTNWNESVWFSEHPTPPRYPNIITIKRGSLVDEQINVVRPQLPLSWAIKDSFSELELKDDGFAIAFDAHWYCRMPNQKTSEKTTSDLHLETVKTQSELDQWVSAWGEEDGIFNLSLIENDAIELVYIRREGTIVAGMATNQSSDSIGISNAFGQQNDMLLCADLVAEKHLQHGIVGYGDEAEVAALSEVGFKEIGDLRIWVRKRM